MRFTVLLNDNLRIAIYKPRGFHVHRHETHGAKTPREKICLYQVRDFVGHHVYPVHRLDAGTSGVLLFAKNSEEAHRLSQQFEQGLVQKTYHAIVRGWPENEGTIDIPLDEKPSLTRFQKIAQTELELNRRYSLLRLYPENGRYHQIRRHLNRISHPIVGDAQHGDSRHNTYFREKTGISGLCLRAAKLEFTDEKSQPLVIEAGLDERWKNLLRLFSLDTFE